MAIIPMPRGSSQCTFPLSIFTPGACCLVILLRGYGWLESGVGKDVVDCSGLGICPPVRRGGIGEICEAVVRGGGNALALRMLVVWERVGVIVPSSSSN